MPQWKSAAVLEEARRLKAQGLPDQEIAERCGVAVGTVRRWRRLYERRGQQRGGGSSAPCPRCEGGPLDEAAYAHLLGWYLGDGHLALARGVPRLLAIFNDVRYPVLNDEVTATLQAVKPGCRVWRRNRPGCVAIATSWHHWPCLLPQHGPGMKHTRPIRLEPWQEKIVEEHPGRLLRGLIHSDGCRIRNWASKPEHPGERYEGYVRYFFTNTSADIRGLCCQALDRLGIHHTHPTEKMISVARRRDVALLDEHVGPKS